MKILVHDYAGHPFQVQLSRELARHGHEVLHAYSASFLTPHGELDRMPGDPPAFEVVALETKAKAAKYSYVRRLLQEHEYGGQLARLIGRYRPELVISANTPLDAQSAALRASRSSGAAFVFWLQDVYGVAVDTLLRSKLGLLGAIVGHRYLRLERSLLRSSDAVVAITEDFCPILEGWGIERNRITVIENWAPLRSLPMTPKSNHWAARRGLTDTVNFLYSGTLGLKHDPDFLLELARAFRDDPDVRVVVISEGPIAEDLARRSDCPNMTTMPFQPFGEMPSVLGAADVLVVLLERDAGIFSVPSKTLTYLCAGRPVLAVVPGANLAGRIIESAHAGLVVPPSDTAAFLAAARRLRSNPELRAELGANARRYAETAFDIESIAARFETLIADAVTSRGMRAPAVAVTHGVEGTDSEALLNG